MNEGIDLAALLPEWILLFGACAALIAGLYSGSSQRSWVSPLALFTVVGALVVSVLQGVPEHSPNVPGLRFTTLSFYVRLIALGVGSLIVLVNWHQAEREERGEYMGLILLSLLGVLLTAAANDLVVLFLAIELVSVPTYVLIALSRKDARASEASIKYFFLGAMSAAILAYGLSFLYGETGTTTLMLVKGGSIASTLPSGGSLGLLTQFGLLLVFAGLAFKIAAVPFHVYAPDVYEGAASPMTGMLGFVPKLGGFIALIKILAAINWDLPISLAWLLWLVAAATMTLGNVLALLQRSVKRMLAYSSIAHTGYMLIGLLVGPVAGHGPMRDGVAALLFYIGVYGAMNLGAFALLSAFKVGDDDVESLDDLDGLAQRAPLASFALAICVFSLMGFPPTAGFLGKLYILGSAFALDAAHPMAGPIFVLAIIGVINSAIGAAYYLRIVAAVYMRQETRTVSPNGGAPVRWALACCSIPMLLLFAWPSPLLGESKRATADLRDSIHVDRARVTEGFPNETVKKSAKVSDDTIDPSPARTSSSSD